MPTSSSPSVAVVGGGLSGLVLARILQQHNIACTVYELDATAGARRQGGLLDLHVESGQLALREAGLYEQFRRLTRPQAEALRVMYKAGTVFPGPYLLLLCRREPRENGKQKVPSLPSGGRA